MVGYELPETAGADAFTEAEVLRRFSRPQREWDGDDDRYYSEVIYRALATGDSPERRLLDTTVSVRHAQVASEVKEYVAGNMARDLAEYEAQTLEGRFRAWLGRLAHCPSR